MITPEYLQRIVEATQKKVENLNQYLTAKVVKQIIMLYEKTGEVKIIPARMHDILKQEAAGRVFDEVQEEIVRQLPNIQQEVRVAFQDAASKINKDLNEFTRNIVNDEQIKGNLSDISLSEEIDWEKLGIPKKASELNMTPTEIRLLESAYSRTNGEIYNITRTTASAAQNNFITACDNAFWKIEHGVSRNTAIMEAVDEVASKGITTVHYGNREDKIEVAIARAVRTGINQASGDMKLALCAESGTNYVKVSSHIGARVTKFNDYTNHAMWQGKVYKLDWNNPVLSKYQPTEQEAKEIKKSFNVLNAIKQLFSKRNEQKEYEDFITVCGYGKMLGISGINCRHNFEPFVPGKDKPLNDIIDPEKNRQRYELEQKQRAYEREIRDLKRRKYAFDHAEPFDEETKQAINEKRRELRKKIEEKSLAYRDFCKANQLSTENYRLQIAKKYGVSNEEGVREYLKIFNCTDEAMRDTINMEYDMIPQKHRDLLEKNGVVIKVSDKSNYKFYDRLVNINANMEQGELIHECAHALEDILNLEDDKRYMSLLDNIVNGHEMSDLYMTGADEYGGAGIWLLKDKRFVSEYQGRMYEDVGLFDVQGKLNKEALWEYFSEGYKTYIINPKLLKEKDSELFKYIEELLE